VSSEQTERLYAPNQCFWQSGRQGERLFVKVESAL